MITVSEGYKTAICASVREMKSQVEIGNHTIDSGIDELKIIENGSASSAISMGAALSNQLDIKLRCPDISVSFETEPINVYEGIKVGGAYELIPLGRFYPKTVDTPDEYKTVTIKAFDALGRAEADEVYEPGITFPADVNDVLDDLCAILGIEHQVVLPARDLPGIIEGSTVKQNLGWLAGIFGYNARMNKQGILVFDWYTDNSIEVSRDVQYQEGYTRKGNAIAVQAVTSGINETVVTAGAGQGIVFENPYITADEVQAIYNRIVGTVFQPCQVKWRGNPAAEITDILSVETSAGVYCKMLVSNQTLDCCGGFAADSVCERSETNSSVTFGNSPTDLKIKQSYTLLQQALKAYANLINGAVGGVFRVTDGNNDGINDGWLIASTEEYPLPADAKCILANSAGIGLSADGGKTYKTAITFDGIAGEFITGKLIVGEQLQIVDEDGNDLLSVMKDEIKLQVIKEAVNEVNVGSRNLLKLSNPNISSATYNIKNFYFGDSPPLADEEVTVSLKGTLGSGKVRWGLYNSGGTVNCTNLTADDLDDDGVYRKTFTWKVGSAANTYLSIYAMLNSVSATSSIEWIKLERGNKATDWSPAPEDQVGKYNVIASINASPEGVEIKGEKISLDGFVKVTNSAEGDDVTNQISMLPGETYKPPEHEWDTNVVIKTERIYNGEKTITLVIDDEGNIGLLNGGSFYAIDDYIHTPIIIENASHDSGTYIRAYQICSPQLILGDVGDVGEKISALSTITKSGYFAKVGNLVMANVYGATTSALPTVPSGYRPSYNLSFPATIILNGNAYMGYVTINTSGVITPYYYDYGTAPKSPVTGCTVYFLATWIIV